MLSKIDFLVRCPYCKHLMQQTFDLETAQTDTISAVIYCDIESGGCDEPFAYRAKLMVAPEEMALAVVGK